MPIQTSKKNYSVRKHEQNFIASFHFVNRFVIDVICRPPLWVSVKESQMDSKRARRIRSKKVK